MAQARRILIADPDLESVRLLSKALRQKGYQVHYAPDGSKALELSVLRHPDLILFDDGCRLIDARTFLQILRTNPRTDDIPVVLTTTRLEADKLRAFRDGYLKKPFNQDEVLSRIEHIFRRADAAKELKGEAKEIEGSLTQLSMADLLQILAMNKRSGRLHLSRGSERGEIFVRDGRPVNARVGIVEGEKALFRLLTWTDGTFGFVPGTPSSRVRIGRAMDDALLEGMRQADEAARLWPSLPPRSARVSLAPDVDLSKDQHPVTAQVVELLKQPRAVAELLDLAPATDLEVLVVLSTLLEKGVARVIEGEPEQVRPLLGPAEIHALRARLFRGRQVARVGVAKVFVCAKSPTAMRRLLREVSGIVPVAAEPGALRSSFGTLGRYELSEALKVDFCVLPTSDAARPLWRPFCTGAVGALLLDLSEPALKLARYLAFDVRVPVVVAANEVPSELSRAPAGATAGGTDLLEAVRALLIQSLNPVQPDFVQPTTAREEAGAFDQDAPPQASAGSGA